MDDTNRISPYWDWQPAQEIPMSLQLSLVSLNHFLTFDKIILCRGFVITSKLWLVSCFICKNNSFIYFWFSFHCHFLNTSNCKILICQIVSHKNWRQTLVFNLVKWIFVHWIRCEIKGLTEFILTWADSKYVSPPGFKTYCDNVAWHFSKNLVTKGFFKQSFHAADPEHVSQSLDKQKYLQVTCLQLLQSQILNSQYLSLVWHCCILHTLVTCLGWSRSTVVPSIRLNSNCDWFRADFNTKAGKITFSNRYLEAPPVSILLTAGFITLWNITQ